MTVVGEAFVVIRPDTSDFLGELDSVNLTRAGRRMSDQLTKQLEVVGAAARREIEEELAGLDSTFEADVRVNADTAEATRALDRLDELAQPIDVPIDVDADPLLADIRKIQQESEEAAASLEKIGKVGDKFTGVGQKLSVGITLPLVLLGKQAISMASDVETTLAQTIGLAGGTAEQVKQANEVIRSLAGETGKSLTDLSEALLAIFSAGFTGAEAFDILDVSAHAAAAGLGDTRDVANAVTNAVSAYGPAVLTAADATDILVNSVKEGKAEASELAPQFGRLLPVASELGISFADVGAGLAFLTRSSGDASLSATQLAGVMNKLLKPSQQGAEALLDAGFSAERIRRELKENGLLSLLVELRQDVEQTGGTFSDVFDDVEALNGALALTRDNGAAAIPVFDHLAESQGSLNSAFAAFDTTKSAELAKASANISVALTDFGNVALPVVADVLGLVSDAAEAFDQLPRPLQTGITAAVGLAAALGPVLIIGGKLLNVYSKVFTKLLDISGLQVSSSLASNLKQAAGAAGILATGAVVGGTLISNALDKADSDAEAFLDGIVSGINELSAAGDSGALTDRLIELGKVRDELAEDFNNAVNPFKRRSLNDAIVGLDSVLAASGRLRRESEDLAISLGITSDQALQLKVAGQEAIDAFVAKRNQLAGAGVVDLDPLVVANKALEDLTLNFLRGKAAEEDFANVSKLTNIPVEDLKDNLHDLAVEAQELGDAFVEGLGGVGDAFATTFGDDAKDTVDAFLDNFAKQTADAAAFTANLQKLIARGAIGLAEEFSRQGVSAAGLAAEAANASEQALADMETRFDFITVAQGAAEKRQRDFATRIIDGTIDLVNDANTEAEGLFGPDIADTVGPRLAAALAQGDEAFFAELDKIAEEGRVRALNAGTDIGGQLAAGLAAGITAGEVGVRAAAAQLASGTEQLLLTRFGIQSPAKMTQEMGVQLAEGLALGMETGLRNPDLSAFARALPSSAGAFSTAGSFGASPAAVGAAVGAGVTFTGDIIVPVPVGAGPKEQAELVGRQVAFSLQAAVG